MKYELDISTKFKKDLKLAKKQGKDLELMFSVIDSLVLGDKLPSSFKDHSLKGDYVNCRECHLEPDWLLIYSVEDTVLALHRLGSHSHLFE